MQRIRSCDWSKAGKRASLLRSLSRGRGANWTLAALLVGLLWVAPPLGAESKSVTITLILHVAEAGHLELQNDSVVVKLRLAPGVAASLWSDKACTTPASESYIITASGTYTIPLSEISRGQNGEGADIGSICLHSSDGALLSSLPTGGQALRAGTMASATKMSSKLTWSGRIAIPARRVSPVRNPSTLPPQP